MTTSDDAYALLGALLYDNWAEGTNIIEHSDDLERLTAEMAAIASSAIESCARQIGVTLESFFQMIARRRVAS